MEMGFRIAWKKQIQSQIRMARDSLHRSLDGVECENIEYAAQQIDRAKKNLAEIGFLVDFMRMVNDKEKADQKEGKVEGECF